MPPRYASLPPTLQATIDELTPSLQSFRRFSHSPNSGTKMYLLLVFLLIVPYFNLAIAQFPSFYAQLLTNNFCPEQSKMTFKKHDRQYDIVVFGATG
jgi:hypothetical protein